MLSFPVVAITDLVVETLLIILLLIILLLIILLMVILLGIALIISALLIPITLVLLLIVAHDLCDPCGETPFEDPSEMRLCFLGGGRAFHTSTSD